MALALPELLEKIFNFLAKVYPALFVSKLGFMSSGPILWCHIKLIGNGYTYDKEI